MSPENDRRFRWIVFGGIAVIIVGFLAFSYLTYEEEPERPPSAREQRELAEMACRTAIENSVGRSDFPPLGSAEVVTMDNGQYVLNGRMTSAVTGRREYTCSVVDRGDQWEVLEIFGID